MASETVQISLRLSTDLHAQLSKYANASNLSLNAVAIQAIQKLLETDDIKRRLSNLEAEVERMRSTSA